MENLPRSNVVVGSRFCAAVHRALSKRLGITLESEIPIGIGSPLKPHRFDLGNRQAKVAVECKAFTWTSAGNMPSAKITTAREAALYLQWLPDEWTKILAMSRSTRPGKAESLAEYFVRLNHHLLRDVVVIEVDGETVRVLHGNL